MPRDILAHPELLPFLTPVQPTVKIIPGEEIHVQRNTDEQAKKQTRSIRNHRPRNAGRPTGIGTGYTTLQTVHTFTLPPGIHCGKRQRFHRMRQRTETATGSEADGKNPAVRYQRERTYKT